MRNYVEPASVDFNVASAPGVKDGIGGTEYDVAHVKWGGNWRLPTKAEINELCEKCNWEWTTVNGVKGQKVTGPNGNSIFLPAAGYRDGTSLSNVGAYGSYWSSTPNEGDSSCAYYLYFYSSGRYWVSYYWRNFGHSVRPVSD